MAAITGEPALRRTLGVSFLGLAVTALVVVWPSGQLAYRSPGGHLVVETTATLVAALIGLLLYGRYRRTASLRDLLLVYAMATFAVAASVLGTLPVLIDQMASDAASSWAALVVRIIGSMLVLAAALVPTGVTHRVSHPSREVVGVTLLVTATVVLVFVFAAKLPDVVDVRVPPEASNHPHLDGHPLLLVVQALHVVCYGLASVAFTRAARRDGDALVGWVGAAAAMGAWARVNYLIFPSLYTEWLYTGDLMRLAFYGLLLAGAVHEIRSYWASAAAAAADRERRRLACDLHDGIIQELGYILSEARRGSAEPSMHRIAAAADRGLHEARRSLRALADPWPETLAAALERATGEVVGQYDVPLHLSLDGAVCVPDGDRDQLVRITREAVVNAVRHATPTSVLVTLRRGQLTVRDDGTGFDPSRGVRPGGFGLTSMRERAEAIGAVFDVESGPGVGTAVRVTW